MKFTNILLLLACCVSFSNALLFPYPFLKYFKQKAVDIIDLTVPKDECSRHLKLWIGDLFNFKNLWALQMLDASAKFQTGFMTGNIFHFGNYDECLSIREDKGSNGIIEGQYCTVALTPAKNTTNGLGQMLDFATSISEIMGVQEGRDVKHVLRLMKMIYGICIPKTCSAETIQKLWNHLEFTFRLPIHVAIEDDFCMYKGKVPHKFDSDRFVFWGFGLFFAFICIISVYDVMFIGDGKGNNLLEEVLIAFSMRRNTLKIFDRRSNPNEDVALSCIIGLKAISMLWVVFGHKYTIGFFSGTVNMLEYFEWRKSIPALLILVSPFSVDTFLVVSGLLLAYKYMQVRDLLPSKEPFPYFMFYFMRLLRLWPCLIATILVYRNILKYLNEGPLWPLVTYKMALSCKYSGWATAFFATNFVSFHYQCIEATWYLAVDTQLYCIAPFMLYFLYKYPKKAALVFVLLSIVSALHSYYVTVVNRERWTLSEGDELYQARIYQSTFVRMPVWIFGLLSGAFLYNLQQIRIHKVVVACMWTLVAALLFGIALVHVVMTRRPYNEYTSALFNATARPAWGIAICMIIILCATGNGGTVNRILSLSMYKPLVKISYSVYLMHSYVIMVIQGNKKSPTFHNTFTTFYGYLGDMPFILITAFLWCLAFESPFINIAKLIIRERNKDWDNRMAIAVEDKKQSPRPKSLSKTKKFK